MYVEENSMATKITLGDAAKMCGVHCHRRNEPDEQARFPAGKNCESRCKSRYESVPQKQIPFVLSSIYTLVKKEEPGIVRHKIGTGNVKSISKGLNYFL